MKKYISLIMISFMIAFLILHFSGCSTADKEVLKYHVESSSMTEDFRIDEGKVFIVCSIDVENNTENDVSFKMNGDFLKDYENNLLTDRYLEAIPYDTSGMFPPRLYSINADDNIFKISSHETTSYSVLFMGNNGEGKAKSDRLPPSKMIFEVIE